MAAERASKRDPWPPVGFVQYRLTRVTCDGCGGVWTLWGDLRRGLARMVLPHVCPGKGST